MYLYGQNDQIIPKKPTKQALGALTKSGAGLRAAYYSGGWHMIRGDKEAFVVLGDVAAFLSNPSAPLHSGADVDALPCLQAAKEDW